MKLLTLLKSLQPDEHKELEKFLDSPFHRVSGQHLPFFQHLCKHHKDFEMDKPALEQAYRRCFGKDAYTDKKLYNLMSGMARQVEDFMVIKLLGTDQQQLRDSLLVQALRQRQAHAQYRTEASKLVEAVEKIPVKGKDDLLLLEKHYSELYFNPGTAKQKPHIPYLNKSMELLDRYFCTAKLRYAAELLNRERLFNEIHDIPMLDAVLQATGQPSLMDEHPSPALYQLLIRLYLDGVTESGFRDMQTIFMQHHGRLHETDQAHILMHLINCGIALGRSDAGVNHELLGLYKLAISTGVLLENGRITHSTFCNIVMLAVLCHELDWATGFMEQYSPNLANDLREPTVQLSTAFIHHAKGELDKAQDCLVQEVFMLPPFDLLARALMMKILFDRLIREGRDYEFLIGQLNAYEKYIAVKQLSGERQIANLNAIRFVRKMANLKLKHRKVPRKEKELLKSKLDNTSPITMKDWLRDKIDAL